MTQHGGSMQFMEQTLAFCNVFTNRLFSKYFFAGQIEWRIFKFYYVLRYVLTAAIPFKKLMVSAMRLKEKSTRLLLLSIAPMEDVFTHDGEECSADSLERTFVDLVRRHLGGSLLYRQPTTTTTTTKSPATDDRNLILEESFFSVGGNSLNAVAVCLALNDAGMPISKNFTFQQSYKMNFFFFFKGISEFLTQETLKGILTIIRDRIERQGVVQKHHGDSDTAICRSEHRDGDGAVVNGDVFKDSPYVVVPLEAGHFNSVAK